MRMLGSKYYSAAVCFVFFCGNLHAQLSTKEAAIIGSVEAGEDRAPAPSSPQPVFNIKNSQHRTILGRSITIHEVNPPPTPVAKITPAPAVQAPQYTEDQTRKLVEEMLAMRVVILSATVYGEGSNQLTKLRIWCDERECEAITTINFLHFTGFGGFRVEGRRYMQIVGAGVAIDTKGLVMPPSPEDLKRANRLARNGTRNRYTIVNIDADDDSTCRQVLDDMVTLYEQEKANLATAYETRKTNAKVRAARRAVAGPQPPKPITIHFWKRDVEQEREQARQQAAQKGESK